MGTLTDAELDDMMATVGKRVSVACCEHHQHSALKDCLGGDERDVAICKLIETLRHERAMMRKAVSKLGNEP